MIFDRYIAHRGLHNIDEGIPENSMKAFEKAVEMGYPIELDIHLTRDGRIVVFHDDNLKRMTGVDKKINELTYEELSKLRLQGTDEGIPPLIDVLKLVRGRVGLLIELKDTAPLFVMENRLCKMMLNYPGFWAIQSFNPVRVGWFAAHCPSIERGQLVTDFGKKKQLAKQIASRKVTWKTVSKPTFISVDLRSISLQYLFDAHDIGAKLITWTATSEELLEEAVKFGRGVIFENVIPCDFDKED